MTGIATAIISAAVITAGVSVHQSTQAKKAAKSRAEAQIAREQAAAKELQQAQATASSQAQARIDAKRARLAAGGRTIFTSPLGLAGQASTAKKKLLGD